jgi:hypothetical protein
MIKNVKASKNVMQGQKYKIPINSLMKNIFSP